MEKEIFKNKDEKELKILLSEKRNLLRDFRFRVTKGKVKNIKESRELRKEIARILTELHRAK